MVCRQFGNGTRVAEMVYARPHCMIVPFEERPEFSDEKTLSCCFRRRPRLFSGEPAGPDPDNRQAGRARAGSFSRTFGFAECVSTTG